VQWSTIFCLLSSLGLFTIRNILKIILNQKRIKEEINLNFKSFIRNQQIIFYKILQKLPKNKSIHQTGIDLEYGFSLSFIIALVALEDAFPIK